ncbi:MAG: hypothetical protein M3347_18550 [Armatimonadota bacterium]|nr:hypothetical protein [Armatimonadota bacterium]
MWTDPIVEEVRKAREDYAAQFDFNIEAMCRDLREQEPRTGHKVVSLPPKRPPKNVEKAA